MREYKVDLDIVVGSDNKYGAIIEKDVSGRSTNKHRTSLTRTLATIKPYLPISHDFLTLKSRIMDASLHLILLHGLVLNQMLVRMEFEVANQAGIAQIREVEASKRHISTVTFGA